MGGGISKQQYKNHAGTLKGASAPPLAGIDQEPPPMDPQVLTYTIVVPEGKGGGDKMTVTINGRDVVVTIPTHHHGEAGGY